MRRTLTVFCFLLGLKSALSQFGEATNANPFVDQMLSEVIANFNESLLVEDEQYVLVVDLFIVRPELQLQVFDGRMEGLKSLNRSSDAILTYSEETGSPIFTIDTSLMLSNLTFKSGAKGQVSIQEDIRPKFLLSI